MKKASLIFPFQLFQDNPSIEEDNTIFLIEEHLYFNQYSFNKMKILFHRATMKFYESFLNNKNYETKYIEAKSEQSDIRCLIRKLKSEGFEELHFAETNDNWLEKRIKATAEECGLRLVKYSSPMFLNSIDDIQDYFLNKKKFRQTEFYIDQRKKRGIMVEGNNQPAGGRWTFDKENRLKYPKNKAAPVVKYPKINDYYKEAADYTEKNFGDNLGEIDFTIIYPVTYKESYKWLNEFLNHRFNEFGHYEDAIVSNENILHHSLLSPLLNAGLLTPQKVLDVTLEYLSEHDIPINSAEGFIRQIIGWREFLRGVYIFRGVEERTKNYWEFSRKIPASFYNATTGIIPLDDVINKVLKSGYCHHIERLMILGNFMLLCEFDPDEVYKWFMEMFVDSYDWVMVPNVYGMSQFADGGLVATKPYISGSNYILKMSDYKKGDWQKTWDALFWRFMNVHRDFFLKNPRLSMLVRSFNKMPQEKQTQLMQTAQLFLDNLEP